MTDAMISVHHNNFISPNCGWPLEPYPVDNDVHTHWCDGCHQGLILKDDKWVSIEETEKSNDP